MRGTALWVAGRAGVSSVSSSLPNGEVKLDHMHHSHHYHWVRWVRMLGYLLDVEEVEAHKRTTWMSGMHVPASAADLGPRFSITPPMIEVTIGGCESSYFAGEQIELTVTFTNTKTRPSSSNSTVPPSPRPNSPRGAASHRKGTHSTSSAPLPRPPTSPGVHQVFHTHRRPSLATSSDPPRTRRGFIGFPSVPLHSHRPVQPDAPLNIAVSRAQRLASSRSLSVSLSPPQLEDPSSNSLAPSPSTPDACAYVRPPFGSLNAR